MSVNLFFDYYGFYVFLQGVLNATMAAFNAVCPGDDGGWMRKCESFGADVNYSVNMGTRGGVIAHLQSKVGKKQ